MDLEAFLKAEINKLPKQKIPYRPYLSSFEAGVLCAYRHVLREVRGLATTAKGEKN